MDFQLLEASLVNREFIYRYLWRFFAQEPDEAALQLWADPMSQQQVDLMAGTDGEASRAQKRIASFAGGLLDLKAVDEDSFLRGLERLRSEYTRLFLGPGRPIVPLWESIYRDPDELLFQESTRSVRMFYRRAGYQSHSYPKVADDGLAIELSFMAALISDALVACKSGNADEALSILKVQYEFLEGHLNNWVSQAYQRLLNNVPPSIGDFYVYALALTKDLLIEDEKNLL